METQIDYWQAHALLEWQIELGATEAIAETPVNRYEAAIVQQASTSVKKFASDPVEYLPQWFRHQKKIPPMRR